MYCLVFQYEMIFFSVLYYTTLSLTFASQLFSSSFQKLLVNNFGILSIAYLSHNCYF